MRDVSTSKSEALACGQSTTAKHARHEAAPGETPAAFIDRMPGGTTSDVLFVSPDPHVGHHSPRSIMDAFQLIQVAEPLTR